MRRLLLLAGLVVLAWRAWARRRQAAPAAPVLVGFADGSAETVADAEAEHAPLVAAAAEALAP
jgi:hypothetical protein